MNNNKLIALLGGTFDPIHHGHLRLATQALNHTPINEVSFLPCHRPGHRAQPKTSAHDRVTMVKLAIASNPHFSINLHEMNKTDTSYTIDTLKALKQQTPNINFCLIMGGDSFASIDTWKDYKQILNYCHLLVGLRNDEALPETGASAELLQQHLRQNTDALLENSNGVICTFPMTPLAISSTEIRQRIKNEAATDQLIPNEVLTYIHQHQLYQEPLYAE